MIVVVVVVVVVVVALSNTRSCEGAGLRGGAFRCVFARLDHGPLPNMINHTSLSECLAKMHALRQI